MSYSDDEVGRATLVVDALLTDPDSTTMLRELGVWFRAAHSGYCDQLDVASDEGVRAAHLSGAISVPFASREIPGWVRLGVLSALTAWLAERSRTCPHTPVFRHPMPVLGAAWKPDLIVCHQCVRLLETPRDCPSSRTCDGCGHAGDDNIPVVGIHVVTLTWLFGACDDCRGWLDPA